MKEYFFSALFACAFVFTGQAQDSDVTAPTWIRMMDDSRTNYFEAIRVFDLYWKDRQKPVEMDEEFERLNEDPADKDQDLLQDPETMRYAVEYRRFLHWKHMMLPFVQPDGTILSPSERNKAWRSKH